MCEVTQERPNECLDNYKPRVATSIHVTGIVQGVGFRPFVYKLAISLSLNGWVKNTSAGVDIYLEGYSELIDSFLETLKLDAPPLSKIDSLTLKYTEPEGMDEFKIVHSEPIPNVFQPISPDICICQDCLKELFDSRDRRYRYPFINCTNCGPRYTIIKDIPYDRPNTTMADFPMCPECAHEYGNPIDRRFHAQPIACPICGPRVWLEDCTNSQVFQEDEALKNARRLLKEGKILAIKGLGGFHLACDATNQSAVSELRKRKLRVDKPFALMLPDMKNVETHCYVDELSRQLLLSPQRPIVIIPRRDNSPIAQEVAPGQHTLGIMLPYTPLHYLLFAIEQTNPNSYVFDEMCLVMTSGNLSEEPIAIANKQAKRKLKDLADGFLLHDRPIQVRCDDSVVRTSPTRKIYPLRRSRSMTPFPVYLPHPTPPLLATGGELKNTFCLTQDNYAFLSHHIGDMENYETIESFEEGIIHLEKLFRIQPKVIACDLHPDYLATRYAENRAENDKLTLIPTQHHHAHIASCMAENRCSGDEQVLGIAFDGTGYGLDGKIWGGEFLIADYKSFQRAYHLAYNPLPGGDTAIRHPARIALAYMWQAGIAWDDTFPSVAALSADQKIILRLQLEQQINTPLTSSMGRLFDAIASLVDVKHHVNYEAQATIELEALTDLRETGAYPTDIIEGNSKQSGKIDTIPLLHAVVNDVKERTPKPIITARFHNTIIDLVVKIALRIKDDTGISKIVLSGGVWQNMVLLSKTLELLNNNQFIVYTHSQVPTNDGGLALGQAAIAAALYN